MATGVKNDDGKYRLSLIPADSLRIVARVMMHGAAKYSEDNWRLVDRQRYVDALLRHVHKFWAGCESDEDSGLPELAHVIACAMIILDKDIESGTFTLDGKHQQSYHSW